MQNPIGPDQINKPANNIHPTPQKDVIFQSVTDTDQITSQGY
jgi:hypothetical protein